MLKRDAEPVGETIGEPSARPRCPPARFANEDLAAVPHARARHSRTRRSRYLSASSVDTPVCASPFRDDVPARPRRRVPPRGNHGARRTRPTFLRRRDDWDAHDLGTTPSARKRRTTATTRTNARRRARISVASASTSTRAWPPRRRATASAAAQPGTQLCSRPSSTPGSTLAPRTAGSARACPSVQRPSAPEGFQNGFQTGFQMFDDTSRLPHTPPRPVEARSERARAAALVPREAPVDSLRETKVLVSTSALARCARPR